MVVVIVQGFGGVSRRRSDRAFGDVVDFGGQVGSNGDGGIRKQIEISRADFKTNPGLVCAFRMRGRGWKRRNGM